MKNLNLSLYLVTDENDDEEKFLKTIEDAINGGVSVVQIREKTKDTLDFYNLALKVKEITAKYNVPLIINDRVDVALAIDADGVHIGQSDMPPSPTGLKPLASSRPRMIVPPSGRFENAQRVSPSDGTPPAADFTSIPVESPLRSRSSRTTASRVASSQVTLKV